MLGPLKVRPAIFDHFWPFGPFSTIFNHLDHFGPFWTIWNHFGPFGICFTIFDHFWPFWPFLTIFEFFHLEFFSGRFDTSGSMLPRLVPEISPLYAFCDVVVVQGDFFHWDPPKNHKYGKKLKYPNWDPPKSSKYGKPWQSVALWKLLVLYFNFFPHLENSGGSQFILRNFRGV